MCSVNMIYSKIYHIHLRFDILYDLLHWTIMVYYICLFDMIYFIIHVAQLYLYWIENMTTWQTVYFVVWVLSWKTVEAQVFCRATDTPV